MDRRHILLEGSLNLRDLGGYASRDGRVVRSGCVFRSDELHALTDADLDIVRGLGIRVVFDLRNATERDARPNRLPGEVELLERASPSANVESRTTEEQIARDELPAALVRAAAAQRRARCGQPAADCADVRATAGDCGKGGQRRPRDATGG